MADINLERKRTTDSATWMWILLAVVAGALLIWWWWPDRDIDEAYEVEGEEVGALAPGEQEGQEMAGGAVTSEQEGAQMEAQGPQARLLPVLSINQRPDQWIGQTVQGQAEVASVSGEQGFWIQEGNERLFVVVDPQSANIPSVEEKMAVGLEKAEVQRTQDLGQKVAELDPEIQKIVQDQQVFLMVDGADVQTSSQERVQPMQQQ